MTLIESLTKMLEQPSSAGEFVPDSMAHRVTYKGVPLSAIRPLVEFALKVAEAVTGCHDCHGQAKCEMFDGQWQDCHTCYDYRQALTELSEGLKRGGAEQNDIH